MPRRPQQRDKFPAKTYAIKNSMNPTANKTAQDVINEARQTLVDLKFDPLLEAVARFRDASTPDKSKDHSLALIFDRVFPRLRAVEVSGHTTHESQQVMINIVAQSTDGVLSPIAQPISVTHSPQIEVLPLDSQPDVVIQAITADEDDDDGPLDGEPDADEED